MAAKKLSEQELESILPQLTGWTIKANKLHREFKFPDFPQAIGFIAAAAVHIEKMNHHPEWLNIYNRVSVDLTTHDAGGITQKDVDLARLLDLLGGKLA